MYRNRVKQLTQETQATFSTGVYGSNKAASFLRDAINGTDSLDIVIFGDSNAGSPGTAGYSFGWTSALSSLGVPLYATPLMHTASNDGSNNRTSGLFSPFTTYSWVGRSTAGATGTVYALSERVQAADASAIELNNTFNGIYVNDGVARASSATTLQLAATASAVNEAYTGMSVNIHSGTTQQAIITAYNGTTQTATVASWSGGTPSATATYTITKTCVMSGGFPYSPAFVPSGTTYTSPANGSAIKMPAAHPFIGGNGSGGNSLQYRVVYGTFSATGGSFRLSAMTGVNTLISGATQSPNPGAAIPTSGGSGYNTATLDFTSSSAATSCSWDGYNNGGTYSVVGPFSVLYHSVIRKSTKGFSVNCMNYRGGATTQFIANKLSLIPKYLEAYLKELRTRQIAASGSGRVIWWLNSGINGPDTSSSWTTYSASIRDTVYNAWIALGYPAADLAFIMSLTHPTVTGDAGDVGWGAARSAVATTANTWANDASNAGKNVCVVDIEKFITAAQLKSRNLYQVLGDNTMYESHLREAPQATPTSYSFAPTTMTYGAYTGDAYISNNGYTAVASLILKNLLEY